MFLQIHANNYQQNYNYNYINGINQIARMIFIYELKKVGFINFYYLKNI